MATGSGLTLSTTAFQGFKAWGDGMGSAIVPTGANDRGGVRWMGDAGDRGGTHARS
ncbi:hypothetical protein [Variovorax sp. RCC_210]|uniref:hypothetical protein n=1 Tax=Variovorax sp. RCC_210 TaxID=3239217 RepID=UPI003525D90A